MKALDHATLMRDAAAIDRYHTHRTHRRQSVGEHSFGVMMLIQQVYPEARKELYLAAMHHDLPEFITGDIPAPVKRSAPHFAVMLEELEKSTAPLYQDFGLSAFEEAVLKWCDTMELVLWCLEELHLGSVYGRRPCLLGLTWLWEGQMVLNHPSVGPAARPLLFEATAAALAAGVPIEVQKEEEHD